MLAQHRQFVSRERPTPAFLVVEQTGHNHLNNLCLRIVDGPRRIKGPDKNDQPPRFYELYSRIMATARKAALLTIAINVVLEGYGGLED
jgi:hypothetical protein